MTTICTFEFAFRYAIKILDNVQNLYDTCYVNILSTDTTCT